MEDEIFRLIKQEQKRQEETLMMIPSENYSWPEVRRAVGSVLSQKYAEGYPGRRYYQGNSVVDEIELLCQSRALKAFGLSDTGWHANVQPHSGCEANLAVYNALLSPGDKIMAMYLPDGGHLSHGWHIGEKRTTFVSKIYNVEFYRVDQEKRVLDYGKVREQAMTFKPQLIISGGTAYPREINHQQMSEIARSTGAYYLADIAHEAGLIAGGANQSPFPAADVVTMTTHKTLRGPRGALIICRKELAEAIDFSVFPGLQGGPHLHAIAGIAVALGKTQTEEFKEYARLTVANAKKLASELLKTGFDVVSGGTDKHLVLLDLRNKKVSGWFIGWALEAVGIVMNRNTVPNETASPFYPSGLRMGTPAITVRGMRETEMEQISKWIDEVVKQIGEREIPMDNEQRKSALADFRLEVEHLPIILRIKKEVADLCRRFPIPS